MADTYVFEVGSVGTFYVNFTDLNGISVNADGDVTLTIKDSVGNTLVASRSMVPIRTGYYMLDWEIPFDFPVSMNDSAVVNATIDGVAKSMTFRVVVVVSEGEVTTSGGQIAFSTSSMLNDLIGATIYRIKEAQQIPIYGEQATLFTDTSTAKVTFGKWNQSASPIVRRNRNIVSSNLYTVDYNGKVIFTDGLTNADVVHVDYNFAWFERAELAEFLAESLQEVNLIAPGTSYDISTMPTAFTFVVVTGACMYALRRLIFGLAFQEPRLVYDTPRDSGAKFSNDIFKSLLEDYKQNFDDMKVKVKRSRWPTPSMIVTPEYTLPGGRSRWFRYLFK
ncbi:MAG: hypothetical protein AABY32_02650 [Nanoarchaeota archaeon]